MIIPALDEAIAFGGDYNPEQWPESVWLEDARLMREAGVNFVSVAIFSWARLQPGPDVWDFAWLDRVLDLLHAHGIRVCLATATASPPPWLIRLHPGILPMTADGVTLQPGSRQHYSPSSPAYRAAAAKLVRALATRYAKHPALAAWHINNEYACHLPECHNPDSTAAFRRWLREKYGTLEALNAAWSTAFWSQLYTDWDEILTPRRAPYHPNPSQQLDFKRFTSDAFLDCLRLELAILRELTPRTPVTTNFMGFFKPLDYHRWARELDFTAWDSYPDPVDEVSARRTHAAGNDLTRSLKTGRPFVLMEQATSAVNWRPLNLPKRPGLMRLWSLQSVARGADGIMFFQWRASRGGAEKFHSAIIQHDGADRSRAFRETAALGVELRQLAPVVGSTIRARVAIVADWHAWWAVELDSRPAQINYAATVQWLHAWFYDHNVAVDFVAPDADFSAYRLVLAPALYLLRSDHAASFTAFVATGGTLLTTWFTGIVDDCDRVHLGGYPAPLRALLGLTVGEFHPYPPDRYNTLVFADPAAPAGARCGEWCDLIELEGAEALATFASDFFAGQAAFTRHTHGAGRAFHLGTKPDSAGLDRILGIVTAAAGISAPLTVPAGVELSLRENASGARFLFLLNHTDATLAIDLSGHAGTDLLTGRAASGIVDLSPLGVAVIALEPAIA